MLIFLSYALKIIIRKQIIKDNIVMKSEQLPNSNNQEQLKNQITLVKRTKNKEEEINEPTHSKVTRFGNKVLDALLNKLITDGI